MNARPATPARDGLPAGGFDELAPAYDRYRIGYASEVYEALVEYGLELGSRVLDLACGTGLVAAELLRRGFAVTALDASEAMLARAGARVPEATFVHASAEALPFAGSAFDGAVCAQAFHWFDERQALAELARTVRPGGVVAIWWKALLRGDPMCMLRDQAARELGVPPPADLLVRLYGAFDESAFVDRRLRVIPWLVATTAGEYLGYERSRARARAAFGEKLDAYLARLGELTGPPETPVSLSYMHLMYLGRVHESGAR